MFIYSIINLSGKKQKQTEKLVNDWKEKYDTHSAEMEQAQNLLIKKTCEINKLKAEIDDIESVTAVVCRENKNLGEEKETLNTQIGGLKKDLHEFEKLKITFQTEKNEMELELDLVKRGLQAAEAKVATAVLEVASAKQESNQKRIEKEEELANIK